MYKCSSVGTHWYFKLPVSIKYDKKKLTIGKNFNLQEAFFFWSNSIKSYETHFQKIQGYIIGSYNNSYKKKLFGGEEKV